MISELAQIKEILTSYKYIIKFKGIKDSKVLDRHLTKVQFDNITSEEGTLTLTFVENVDFDILKVLSRIKTANFKEVLLKGSEDASGIQFINTKIENIEYPDLDVSKSESHYIIVKISYCSIR